MIWRFRKPLFCGVLALLLALTVLLGALGMRPASRALAQEENGKPGVDVLFLVDQSGSMGGLAAGSTVHPTPNDALGLRFEAPQAFAQLLAEDRLQVHPNGLHRVALAYFGDTVDPRLKWTEIAPSSWEELQAQLNSLKGENGGLAAGKYATNNLGNTNFLQAFDTAAQMFATLPAGETNRQRVLIVLTDGQPCVPPPATPTPAAGTPTATPGGYASPCQYPPAHMQNLVSKSASFFPANQFKTFVVAMNDSTDNYWPGMKSYWEKISSNRARKVSTNTDVSRLFYDIWKELSPSLPRPEGDRYVTVNPISPGPVVVPPYLDTITFTLFKKRPEETLQIYDTSDTLLTKEMSDVEISGENILKVKVFSPLPGRWRVSTTGSTDNVDIEMRAVAAQGRLNSPRGSQIQFVPTDIEWQLLDSRGQPLPEYAEAQYRLEPVVQIKSEGESTPVRLQYKGNSAYLAEFTPTKAGPHSVYMEALAHDVDGQPIVVYRGEIGQFSVGAVSLQPTNLAQAANQFIPMPLSYELRDTDGRPVGVRSSVSVSTTISSASGSAVVPLQATEDGRFDGEFVPTTSGAHEVTVAAFIADAKGQMRLLTEGPGGSFNVLPPKISAKSPVGAQSQFSPMTISYQVLDGQGNALQLAPGYQMVFTATVGLAGQTGTPVTLQPSDKTTYAASYTADQQGSYEIKTFAGVQGPDGHIYPASAHQAQVAVIPTTRIGLQLIHPNKNELRQYSRKFALRPAGLFSAPSVLTIEVNLVGEDGKPVDPSAVLVDNPSGVIELRVVDATSKKSHDATFVLAKTDVPGVYRAEGAGLPPGSYDISAAIPAQAKTQPAYIIPENQRTAQATVKLRENPFWIGMWVLIIILLGVLIWWFTGGPVGTLQLVDSTDSNKVFAGPWTLRGRPRRVRIRSKTLADQFGIRSIRLGRAQPLDPEVRRAVSVAAKDTNGADFYSGTMDAGDQMPFVPGADILYRA
jgi:hypothetical protein